MQSVNCSFLFLARLYECTGRAIALPPVLAAAVASAWTKCLSFMLKILYDGQGAVRRAIVYADRSCFFFDLRLHIDFCFMLKIWVNGRTFRSNSAVSYFFFSSQ